MEKIVYGKKPRPIQIVNTRMTSGVCLNCAKVGHVYKLLYNVTDFKTPKGNIGKRRYAKDREIWLCDECYKELNNALKEEK